MGFITGKVVIGLAWFINNWSLLVVAACVAGLFILYSRKFMQLPTEAQIGKVREWLLYAVIEAEKTYQSGTGRLKLAATYNEFCKVFPSLVTIISFELFSRLVDEALVQMRSLLETNKDIEFYVKGE